MDVDVVSVAHVVVPSMKMMPTVGMIQPIAAIAIPKA
jgi:hypothetical protein